MELIIITLFVLALFIAYTCFVVRLQQKKTNREFNKKKLNIEESLFIAWLKPTLLSGETIHSFLDRDDLDSYIYGHLVYNWTQQYNIQNNGDIKVIHVSEFCRQIGDFLLKNKKVTIK